ncbi:uncharacterized mitochondrial protein-like protein [Tanacetum coccineum]
MQGLCPLWAKFCRYSKSLLKKEFQSESLTWTWRTTLWVVDDHVRMNQSINTPISPVYESKEFSSGGTKLEAKADAQLLLGTTRLDEGMDQAGSGVAGTVEATELDGLDVVVVRLCILLRLLLMLHMPSCDPRGPCHNSPPACVEADLTSCQTFPTGLDLLPPDLLYSVPADRSSELRSRLRARTLFVVEDAGTIVDNRIVGSVNLSLDELPSSDSVPLSVRPSSAYSDEDSKRTEGFRCADISIVVLLTSNVISDEITRNRASKRNFPPPFGALELNLRLSRKLVKPYDWDHNKNGFLLSLSMLSKILFVFNECMDGLGDFFPHSFCIDQFHVFLNQHNQLPKAVNTIRLNSAVVNDVRANQVNAVKALACWVWRPTKLNSASVTFKELFILMPLMRISTVRMATLDESMLWHRRLGHVNFKTINKLVKDNLVKGLLIKRFENDQTCDACLKGKQHKASYHLCKFDGKYDDGFFVGYSLNSKAFRVYNIRTRKVKENLHVRFLEDKPIIAGDGPKTPKGSSQDYILMPLWKDGSLFDSSSKDASNDEPQPSNDAEKKDDEGGIDDQEKTKNSASVVICGPIPTAQLESTYTDFFSDESELDLSNIATTYPVPSTPNTRIHKDHSLDHVTGDIAKEPKKMDVKSAFLYGKIEEEVLCLVHFLDLKIQRSDIPDKVYKMTSMGELTFFLGLQVTQKDDEIFISQDKYVDEILKKFSFSTEKTTSTPMETSKPLLKVAEAEDVDVHLYRPMIGSLMYLTASRPDIMFVVCACARFQVTPKVSHLHVVKRIFRYLKGQPKLGLWYPKDSPFDLEAYTDSDYAGASLDMKSTIGGCQFLERRLISWQCKKQTIVANSTTKAEYVAASNKTVIKEWEDRMERVATTASSLEAEQDSGDINRTQSMTTLNESFAQRTDSGSGPRCQDTILEGAEAQIRFEDASKQSNDPPL